MFRLVLAVLATGFSFQAQAFANFPDHSQIITSASGEADRAETDDMVVRVRLEEKAVAGTSVHGSEAGGRLGLDGKIHDPVQNIGADTIPRFIELMEADTPGTYSFQITLSDPSGKPEHVWLKHTGHDATSFSGLIVNVPKIATQYNFGQSVTVSRAEISDWMIMSETAIYGGYTMRPALKFFPKEKAEAIRKLLRD